MPDQSTISDPLTDPRVVAARARVTSTERTRERFADVTAETQGATATMRIYGRFDSAGAPWGISAQDVADALDALPEGTDRLDLHIHSRGGDAFEGLAVYNLLRNAAVDVHVTVDGLAASAASAVAMAGKTVTMNPSSQLMIHDASGIGVGQAEDLRTLAAALDVVSDSYAAAYAARAGGDPADWRAAMQPETWYRPEEAVAAGLADTVLATPGADQAATADLDLSVFAYAGRDNAPAPFMPAARAAQTPAEPPETPPTGSKEADAMSEPIPAWLRERLELPEDADQAAAEAKLDELDELATKPTRQEPAPAAALDPKAIAAALEADGQVVVSKAKYDALEAQARDGAAARAKQITDERDELIEAAMSAGKISRSDETRKVWEGEFARNFETAKADLESLPARFPVGQPQGFTGSDGSDGSAAVFSDDEAAALAQLSGTTKEALLS